VSTSDVRALCEQTLSSSWREGRRSADGVPYGYTRPSPGHYPFQWYWDSCFAAIVRRRFDPGRARTELESLLAAADGGFIGHTIFWDAKLNRRQRLTYNVISPSDTMTATIQPPLLAWAWRIAVGDPREVAGIADHHRWLTEHRDLHGDGLLWIVQPDESGLDASPQFDAIWQYEADGLPGFAWLVHHNRRRRYDMREIAAAGDPLCCEVMTNVLWGLARLSMGEPSITGALIDRCYDEQSGLFRPAVMPKPRKVPTLTWASLAPLALPDLPEAIGRRLVEEHLLDPHAYWLPVPPPSVPANDPSFSNRESTLGVHRYWRGPTWVNAAWLLWLGMRRLGYDEQAQTLATAIVDTVAKCGLREYYDPYNGAGMGATSFAWSTLVMELLEPDARATNSYCG
jgi:hypothetical protein